MDKIFYYGAVLVNLIFVAVVLFILTETRGNETFFAALMLLPPLLSLKAIYCGPDMEERRLAKAVRKAELKAQLAKLEKGQ
ncbi:MAG TPA: hypothetical protein EYG18_08100 [Micavibrio sp.]|nr:hypothetical protein [Pseudomonadota bacterium]MEC8665614.1 hypothetical protein [Pseudomonadota bacterium]HIF25908.1 hypothetical protein [Micavibrio sp.]HIL29216.1 hypothetical protein [Micavibrio sp.]